MELPERTLVGNAVTDLVLELFRLNSLLLSTGDKLVGDLGLTSARWQVLETIVSSERTQPVAWLARDMGANRQNVQRIVNDLEKEGCVAFQPNPHHRRAQLVVLTEKGRRVYQDAFNLQVPWVNALAEGFDPADIATASRVLSALRAKLEDDGSDERN